MATCRECLHQELCDTYSRMGVTDVPADDITICELFTPKSDYVKRECGEWIKEYRRFSTKYGWCAKPIFICSRCGTAYWSEQDFCEVCKADMRKEDNNER